MDKRTELTNILRAELTLLTKEIMQNIHQQNLNELYKSTRKLYEKMAAIQVILKEFKDDELLGGFIPQKQEVKQQSDSKQQKEFTPEKAQPKVENPYQKATQMSFVPKDKKEQTFENKVEPKVVYSPKFSGKKMSIGLNDKISFINNLFNGSEPDYRQTIERLNAFDDYEAALRYLNVEVKPKYNHWEGKDEYEFRLIQLLELKFN
jgi:hypothetical protein